MSLVPLWDGSSPTRSDVSTYRAPDGSDWQQMLKAYSNNHDYCDMLLAIIGELQNQLQLTRNQLIAQNIHQSLGLTQQVTDADIRTVIENLASVLAFNDSAQSSHTYHPAVASVMKMTDMIGMVSDRQALVASPMQLKDKVAFVKN